MFKCYLQDSPRDSVKNFVWFLNPQSAPGRVNFLDQQENEGVAVTATVVAQASYSILALIICDLEGSLRCYKSEMVVLLCKNVSADLSVSEKM